MMHAMLVFIAVAREHTRNHEVDHILLGLRWIDGGTSNFLTVGDSVGDDRWE